MGRPYDGFWWSLVFLASFVDRGASFGPHCITTLTATRHQPWGSYPCTADPYEWQTDDTATNDYSSTIPGGCVQNKADHIRLLDQSLRTSSGTGIFQRINDILQQESTTTTTTPPAIHTAQQLDGNTRFGILSHGIQTDPIFNYGNRASLELFEHPTVDTLCQTPSRYSTVPSLMDDRETLIQQIQVVGYGTLYHAIRITTTQKLFILPEILIWHVYHDDDNRRIGLAAMYDRNRVEPYHGPVPE